MTLLNFFSHNKKGFTLVELLVSISIIAVLSTITFASFSQAQKRGRITKRISDLKQVQVALEYYYAVNRSYPNTNGNWISQCTDFEPAGTNVIPGLVPNYISKIPTDPRSSPNTGANRGYRQNCYAYRSDNGNDYAFIAHDITDFSAQDYLAQPALVDPLRDGGTSNFVVDGTSPWAWKVYSPGGASF